MNGTKSMGIKFLDVKIFDPLISNTPCRPRDPWEKHLIINYNCRKLMFRRYTAVVSVRELESTLIFMKLE